MTTSPTTPAPVPPTPLRTDPVRINPTTWNQFLGFDQAQLRPAPSTWLTLAGQGPTDAEGRLQHAGDVPAQLARCLDNVEDLLGRAGFTFADVLTMTVWTTDVDAVLAGYDVLIRRLAPATPPATLVGVQRLALAGMAVEITVQAGR
ncbi:RidA family protein [Kineococcus gynurae]|uniref:RidA family protein n=1 Tax=Kineococcus gynurae TaxID=452979 RepID=A0ABV5LV05_9ACTN